MEIVMKPNALMTYAAIDGLKELVRAGMIIGARADLFHTASGRVFHPVAMIPMIPTCETSEWENVLSVAKTLRAIEDAEPELMAAWN